MKLGQVGKSPVTYLPISGLILVGIKNTRKIPGLQRLRFEVQQATHIPKTSKLQTFGGLFGSKVRDSTNRNLHVMAEKSRFLKR
jgi:hypothetical protein